MTIKILHLYYDLMNLYGESGNVKMISQYLKNVGCKVKIDLLTVNDEIEFEKYDFIFMGQGTEYNQRIALNDLQKYKENLKKAIESYKHVLFTGNSYELLASTITNIYGEKYDALKIFNFDVKENTKRKVGNIQYTIDKLELPLLGFCNILSENNYDGDFVDNENNKEGIWYKNFIGTHMIGPILVKNPHLLQKIVSDILKEKGIDNIEFEKDTFEEKAYYQFFNKKNN